MNDLDVLRAVEKILIDTFDVPAERLRPETTFENLELDSLALAELAVLVQEELGVFPSQVRSHSTLREAVDQILDLVRADPANPADANAVV
jgi:acyl carrier protein